MENMIIILLATSQTTSTMRLKYTMTTLGMALIGRELDGSLIQQERRFRTFFGAHPNVVRNLWVALVEFENLLNDYPDATCEHLLWTLYFLKVYAPFAVHSAHVGCDKKTYSKWVWIFVERIANLHVVKVKLYFFV